MGCSALFRRLTTWSPRDKRVKAGWRLLPRGVHTLPGRITRELPKRHSSAKLRVSETACTQDASTKCLWDSIRRFVRVAYQRLLDFLDGHSLRFSPSPGGAVYNIGTLEAEVCGSRERDLQIGLIWLGPTSRQLWRFLRDILVAVRHPQT